MAVATSAGGSDSCDRIAAASCTCSIVTSMNTIYGCKITASYHSNVTAAKRRMNLCKVAAYQSTGCKIAGLSGWSHLQGGFKGLRHHGGGTSLFQDEAMVHVVRPHVRLDVRKVLQTARDTASACMSG